MKTNVKIFQDDTTFVIARIRFFRDFVSVKFIDSFTAYAD